MYARIRASGSKLKWHRTFIRRVVREFEVQGKLAHQFERRGVTGAVHLVGSSIRLGDD